MENNRAIEALTIPIYFWSADSVTVVGMKEGDREVSRSSLAYG